MKKVFGFLVLVQISLLGFSQNYAPVPVGNPLEDARKSLGGATAMSIVSGVTQGIGYVMTNPGLHESNDQNFETTWIGLLIGVGGVGMETNSPILISRANRQIKRWDCPAEDILVKQKILKNIRAAQTISIFRTVLPFAGILAGRLFLYEEDGGEQFEKVFFGCWAASILMTIPEVILIEESQSQIKGYQQQLKIGATEQGLGMTYKF